MKLITTVDRARWSDYRDLKLESLREAPLAFSPGLEVYEKYSGEDWQKELTANSTYPYAFVFAEEGGVLVGMCGIRFFQMPQFAHNVSLQGLYVSPKSRGKGIGKALIDECLKMARAHPNIRNVISEIFSSQQDSIALHRACGFEIFGRVKNFLRATDGKEYDSVFMQRKLGTSDAVAVKQGHKQVPKFIPREDQVDFTNARWAPVVNTIVTYNGKILLVQRNPEMHFYPGYWNGISGFLDDARSLEEKVADEVTEEIGIGEGDIESIRLCDIFNQEEPEYGKTWIVHAALAEIATDEIALDWEATRYEWVNPGEAKNYKLLPGFDHVIDAALPYLT